MADQKKSFFRRYPLITGLLLFLALAFTGFFGFAGYGGVWELKRHRVLNAESVAHTAAGKIAPLSRQLGAWMVLEHPSSEMYGLAVSSVRDQPGIFTQLQSFPELRELRLSRGDISPKEAALILRLPSITALSLDSIEITPEAWDVLAPWAAQRNVSIELGRVSASDQSLEIAARHKLAVRRVALGKSVSSKGIALLSSFPQLQSIDAYGAALSPAEWTALAAVPKLKDLAYEQTDICDEAFAVLSKVESMKAFPTLDLSNDLIGDAGIECMKQNQVFSSVVIGGKKITSAGVAALGEVPGLSSVRFKDQHLDEKGVLGLSRSPSIAELVIIDGTIDEGALATLGQCKSVQRLDLTGLKILPEGAQRMAEGFKDRTLFALNLARNDLGDEAFTAIAQIKTRNLVLSDETVGDRGLLGLKDNSALLDLNLLLVGATGEGLAALGEMKNLQRANIAGPIVEDQALEWFSRQPMIDIVRLDRMDVVETLDANAPKDPEKGRISIAALIRALRAAPNLHVSVRCPTDPTRMQEFVTAGVSRSSKLGFSSQRLWWDPIMLRVESVGMPAPIGAAPAGMPFGGAPYLGAPAAAPPAATVAAPSSPLQGIPSPAGAPIPTPQ
jgi:hypothetical protein